MNNQALPDPSGVNALDERARREYLVAYFKSIGRSLPDKSEPLYQSAVQALSKETNSQGVHEISAVFFEYHIDRAVWATSFKHHGSDTPQWPWNENPSPKDRSQGISLSYRKWRLDNGLQVVSPACVEPASQQTHPIPTPCESQVTSPTYHQSSNGAQRPMSVSPQGPIPPVSSTTSRLGGQGSLQTSSVSAYSGCGGRGISGSSRGSFTPRLRNNRGRGSFKPRLQDNRGRGQYYSSHGAIAKKNDKNATTPSSMKTELTTTLQKIDDTTGTNSREDGSQHANVTPGSWAPSDYYTTGEPSQMHSMNNYREVSRRRALASREQPSEARQTLHVTSTNDEPKKSPDYGCARHGHVAEGCSLCGKTTHSMYQCICGVEGEYLGCHMCHSLSHSVEDCSKFTSLDLNGQVLVVVFGRAKMSPLPTKTPWPEYLRRWLEDESSKDQKLPDSFPWTKNFAKYVTSIDEGNFIKQKQAEFDASGHRDRSMLPVDPETMTIRDVWSKFFEPCGVPIHPRVLEFERVSAPVSIGATGAATGVETSEDVNMVDNNVETLGATK